VTATLAFFRSMGGVVGVAIGGSLINNMLTNQGVDANNYKDVFSHPDKYAIATQAVFRMCIAWPALALISSLFIEHYELRKTVGGGRDDSKASEKIEEVPEAQRAADIGQKTEAEVESRRVVDEKAEL